MTKFSLLPIIGLLALSACTQTTSNYRPVYPLPFAPTPVRAPGDVDADACVAALAQQIHTSINVMSSEYSEANTLVMLGVGPRNAPYKCLSSHGVVAEITSLTDEGAL